MATHDPGQIDLVSIVLFTQFEFIFVFVPVTLTVYFLLGMGVAAPAPRLIWLAAASLAFYGYWDVRLLPVIGISIVAKYAFGLLLMALPAGSPGRRPVFAAAVAANLLALAFFKYTNFAVGVFNDLTHAALPAMSIALPLGISFFTFTQIAYLADVFAGHPYERNFVREY